MGDVVVKALVLVLVIAMGFGLKRLGWVQASDFGVFSRVVLRVTLPCALATNFNTFEIKPGLLFVSAIGFLAVFGQQGVIALTLRRRDHRERAFAVLNLPNYNIGLFAIPYVSTFLGPSAIVYASLFDIGNSLAAAGIGYGWGLSLANPSARLTPLGFVRTMLASPVFDTYLILLAIRLPGVTLPGPVIRFTSTVGAANTFLAMFMIGVGLEIALTRMKYVTAAGYLAVRYAIAIVLGLAVWFLVPAATDVKTVLCMLFVSPMAAMTAGFTNEAGLDVEVSSFMTSASVLIGILAMPGVLALLGA